MRTGYLDAGSGRWVDTAPPTTLDDERTVEVGGDGLVRPAGAPLPSADTSDRKVQVDADGLVRPSRTQTAPMSTVEKAKMIKARRQTTTAGSQ